MNAITHITPLTPADIVWGDDGVPRSHIYDDVYFSARDGLAESRYIFLSHNNLPERWKSCTEFTICETGFGTGLNFLATWQAWRETTTKHDDATLHFISIEKHPLPLIDVQRAHNTWPELVPFAEELHTHYPDLTPGFHQLTLDSGRVILTLCFGDIADTLPQLTIPLGVDAWFLDGFSPATNPDMWQELLGNEMARLSAQHASFSTFTAAKAVKESLQKHGFDIRKEKGFAYKRDMLRGQLIAGKPTARLEKQQKHLIIGGGLAGCSVAHALAHEGHKVTLIERRNHLASGASGNPAGILFPLMHKGWNPLTSFYMSGYGTTRRLLNQLRKHHDIAGEFCGMIQFPKNTKQAPYFTDLPDMLGLTRDTVRFMPKEDIAERLHAEDIAQDGLFFPQGGWVNVPDFCAALSKHPNITICYEEDALTIENHAGEWHITTASGTDYKGNTIIIANAKDAEQFEPTSHLPMHSIRGQISYVPEKQLPHSIEHVICSTGYVTPAHKGHYCLGATYERERTDTETAAEGHQMNAEKASKILPPSLCTALAPETWGGRAALRTMSRDRHPIIGKVVDGLYVSLAHGSRGIISCPLAAQMIASHIANKPAPLAYDIMSAFSHNRFKTKQI